LNNNRNNRRRGRGSRPQGGGNQNRIDSRARGNAPQMLDKYKKLAQDAAHNGDRVQAEYYLQFADHYFRVLADNKSRQDDTRGGGGGRRDERDFQSDDDGDEDDFDILRQPQGRQQDRQNDRAPERSNDRGADRPNERQAARGRGRPDDRQDTARSQRDDPDREVDSDDGDDFAGAGNPFTRGNRDRGRDLESDAAPRRGRPRRDSARNEGPADNAGEIDAAALPPSISASANAGNDADGGDERPKRKLPPRRRRPAPDEAGEDGESLKAVG
jgi:hypothetical protein